VGAVAAGVGWSVISSEVVSIWLRRPALFCSPDDIVSCRFFGGWDEDLDPFGGEGSANVLPLDPSDGGRCP